MCAKVKKSLIFKMKKKSKFSKSYNNQDKSSKPTFTLEPISDEKMKKIISKIETTYNTTFKYYPTKMYINSKNKLYFSTIEAVPEHINRINAIGLYLGTLLESGEIRLSIEGAELLEMANQNYIYIKEEYLSSYLSGENLFFEEVEEESTTINSAFQILYDSNNQALGVISKKEKYYLNYLSKGRKMDFNKVF